MIIGNGMMAHGFSRYRENDAVLIFASGVANSRETEPAAFRREESILAEALRDHRDKTFVYFGTCSVGDPEAGASPYVLHKLHMEGVIRAGHPRSLIFRLPQVVGRSANRTTLVNHFYDRITRGEPFTVWRHATRYLIDLDDVVALAGHIIDRDLYRNRVMNIAALRYPVIGIVGLLEKITEMKGVYTVVDRGEPFAIDVSLAKSVAETLHIEFDGGYLERTLRKYYTPASPGRPR